MIFYRLALHRWIEYFGLDKLFGEDKEPIFKIKKKNYSQVFQPEPSDPKLDLYMSVLLSTISMLVWLSMPYAALESPCEIFKEINLQIFYPVAKFIETYLYVLDYFIAMFLLMLMYVSTKIVPSPKKNNKIHIWAWIYKQMQIVCQIFFKTKDRKKNTNDKNNEEQEFGH